MNNPGQTDRRDLGGATGTARPAAVEFRSISKSFFGQQALSDVSFAIQPGEVHALVGENGAGKTTLIKVLAGEHRPESGEILIDGEPVDFHHPDDSRRHGIGFIHQIPAQLGRLSVAENIALGTGYKRRHGLISWADQMDLATRALAMVGLESLDPRTSLGKLGPSERQLVALAKVLIQDPKLIVFDEVTAPLTQSEVERLFTIVKGLRDRGVASVYISHRLDEIFALADTVTVLRNGHHITTEPISGLDIDRLTSLIIGQDPEQRFEQIETREPGPTVLEVKGLTDARLREVSLELREGEILGLAGLAGSGRTEILESIFALRKPDAGEVFLDGRPVTFKHPADAIRSGIALVTEERGHDGYIGSFPIWKNITLPWLGGYRRGPLQDLGRERGEAASAAESFDVRARSVDTPMRELSGGNQQKTILARWLSNRPRVLLLDEPTHGVDIGAKEQIYGVIRDATHEGVSVILASSEFEEIEGLADRVLLLADGAIFGELTGEEITTQAMLSALLRREHKSNGGTP